MTTLVLVLVLLVAALHLWFLVLEMLLWTKPIGLKTFRNTPEKAEIMRVLAANQGLYNGFLVAGLVWSVIAMRTDLALFFLGCVLVAGIFGAATVSRRLFFVQGLPALLGIVAIVLAH
ncbi:MAG: DUF1304 domain-containing protein [Luteimonas sp.]